jgi:DNA repair protein RadA/Sms
VVQALPKWVGKCPSCGEWNSYVEEVLATSKKGNPAIVLPGDSRPMLLDEVSGANQERINVGIGEFNRVLGGGLVPGSVVLIGGEPGIGKSTLVLQFSLSLKGKKILYASGEESLHQIKLRAHAT